MSPDFTTMQGHKYSNICNLWAKVLTVGMICTTTDTISIPAGAMHLHASTFCTLTDTTLYIKSNIPVTIKPEQTFIRDGIESNFAELTTNGIIVVGLIYKRSVDISTEKFSVALEPLISSLDPRVKTYTMGDFNINLLDHNLSPPVENFINQMISKNFLPIIDHPLE